MHKSSLGRRLSVLLPALLLICLSPLSALPPERLSFPLGPAPAPERGETDALGRAQTGLPGLPVAGPEDRRFSLDDYRNRALVLCWHTFLGKPEYDTDFSLTEFAAQIDAIRALGYGFPTVEDFLAGRIAGSKNVILTIDDGNHSVPAAIAKVLLPRGIRPSLFVYPAVLGTTDFSMSDRELAELAAQGIPAGAHGYHHLRVTEALFKASPREFMDEIYKAKAKAEALSKSSVLVYAYPYGALSPRTELEVAKAGYSAAFAVRPGFVFARTELDELYDLPRLVVLRSSWPDILSLLRRNAEAADRAEAVAGAQALPLSVRY